MTFVVNTPKNILIEADATVARGSSAESPRVSADHVNAVSVRVNCEDSGMFVAIIEYNSFNQPVNRTVIEAVEVSDGGDFWGAYYQANAVVDIACDNFTLFVGFSSGSGSSAFDASVRNAS